MVGVDLVPAPCRVGANALHPWVERRAIESFGAQDIGSWKRFIGWACQPEGLRQRLERLGDKAWPKPAPHVVGRLRFHTGITGKHWWRHTPAIAAHAHRFFDPRPVAAV